MKDSPPVPDRKRIIGLSILLYSWGAVVGGGVFFGYGDLPQLCFGATLWSIASASLFQFVDRPWARLARSMCSFFAIFSMVAWFAARFFLPG